MNKKKIIVSVTNDLFTDQRVARICDTLYLNGFEVLLLGRRLPNSSLLSPRVYKTKRLKLFFKKGFLFYAEYNLRLFFFLLFSKFDILYANDLDTLLANFVVSRLRKKELIYDSHEYFTEVPELTHRAFVKKVWLTIEKIIFPKLKYVITVNNSIAQVYEEKYKKPILVIRNLPYYYEIEKVSRKELNLPTNKKIVILQGRGINIDRGAEEAIEAIKLLDETILLIIGDGDVLPKLKLMVKNYALDNKVLFYPQMDYLKLMQYTTNADVGISLDKDTNLNYRFSLPNKLFDYIQAEIPVLASPLPEIKIIIEKYKIGKTIDNHNPYHIAEKLKEMLFLADKNYWLENLKKAKTELCWEKERIKLIKLCEKFK